MKFFVLIFFISSCSFFTVDDPRVGTAKRIQHLLGLLTHGEPLPEPKNNKNSLAANYLYGQFLEANGRDLHACEKYTIVSSQQDNEIFLYLSLLAQLRTCPELNLESFLQNYPLEIWPKWSHETYLRQILKLAGEKTPARVLYELSFFEKTAQLKLDLLQKAFVQEPDNETIQLEIYKVAPRLIKNPKHDELYSVARDFEQVREFDKARGIYRRLIQSKESSLELILSSYERIAQTLRVERNREVYWKELDKLALELDRLAQKTNSPLAAKAYIENRITKARALWTAHQREAGQAILNPLLASKLLQQDQKAQIYYILGAMELEAEKSQSALTFFKQGLNEEIQDRKILEQLLWSQAWTYYLAQNYKLAIESLEKGTKRLEEQSFKSKAQFWIGMSYLQLKELNKSQIFFDEVRFNDPYSYYGILAHHKLDASISPLPNKGKRQKDDELSTDFDWLIFLGEKEAARNELKERIQNKEVNPRQALVSFYEAEIYDEAIFQFARLQSELSKSELKQSFTYGYPRPYQDLYQKYSEAYSFPRELALSLTRQESAFNPFARSWADAFGLMQLIPERAQQLARTLRVPFKHHEELFDTDLNIKMGVFHLSELKTRYDDIFPFYIAAYNAGERPVTNWKAHRFDGNQLEFIENIPYRETQNYVKLILRNAVIYRMLSTDKPFNVKEMGLIL